MDCISQDIAGTLALLHQLENELKKDEQLHLCSQEAATTVRGLVEDCNKIFSELNEALDSKSTGHKLIVGWKQRLRYPFLEPQINLLRATLERLKISLLVMLNVLIFAQQLRREATTLCTYLGSMSPPIC